VKGEGAKEDKKSLQKDCPGAQKGDPPDLQRSARSPYQQKESPLKKRNGTREGKAQGLEEKKGAMGKMTETRREGFRAARRQQAL